MAEPVQRFVDSQRVRISYWDWGNDDAPPLVLVHGGRDHARSWDRIADGLRDRYHVVAPDLRGHGDSGWSPDGSYGLPANALDVVRIMESVGTPTRVVAHSYGGSVCLLAAGVYPELFTSLAILEGTHSLNPPADVEMGPGWVRQWADRVRAFETAPPPRVYASIDEAAERMREVNPRLPDDFVRDIAAYAARPVEGGFVWKFDLWLNGRTSMEIRRDELPRFWEAITCPVLLFLGGPSPQRQRQHPNPGQHIRGLRVVNVPDSGHWIHHDAPDLVLRELRSFLADERRD